MSKLSRSALKGIVKECLIEILAEGLVSPSPAASMSKRESLKEDLIRTHDLPPRTYQNSSRKSKQSHRSYLDTISFDKKESKKLDQHAKQAVSKITSDPVMSEILADTLKRQSIQETRMSNKQVAANGDAAAKMVDSATPESLFGADASSKWASLAFAAPITKK